MKRLQIAIYNIDIGHCKVYSRDFVTYIIWFIEFLKLRIPNSKFRKLKSEFWIPNSVSRKKVVDGNVVFGYATSGSVHGIGEGVQEATNN